MCRAHSDQGVRGAEARDAPTAAKLSHRGGHRESEAQSFRSEPLGGCSESEAQSYAAGPGFGRRESSRFLGTKRWKSQKLRQLSPEQPSEWKASDGEIGPLRPDCSHRFSAHFAAT